MENIRRSFAASVLLCGVLASLGSSSQPTINAAAKADVDRRVAALAPSTRAFPAPTTAEPPPLAAGQWITVKQTDQDGRPSFNTFKIVGMQDGAYWYEVSMDSYYGHTAVRMLLAVGDRRDPATFDVRAYFIKDAEGRVQEMPAATLGMVRSTYQSMLDQLVIRWDQLPQEDVTVVAGSFSMSFKGRSTVSMAGMSATSDVWYHPAVPVNGLVKSIGVDRPSTLELIDFGLEGARSEF